jgi:hypothetical protein
MWISTYKTEGFGRYIHTGYMWMDTLQKDMGQADTQQTQLMKMALSEDLMDILIVDITLKLFLPLSHI